MRSVGVSEMAATENPTYAGHEPDSGLVVRRLSYGDLPAVLAIERRSFPTPWSLAMFVLELSKPSGDLPRRPTDEQGLAGYLVCSRYADVWHLMNVAVDPERRRRGIATQLIETLLDEAGRGGALHARGPRLQRRRRSRCTSGSASARPGTAAATTTTTARTP